MNKTKRSIIKIDEVKCNGCGLCIPNCPEGAIQIIDGKARLISDLFCDGLGACLGHCPQGAISIEERNADAYDEKKVMANIVKQGKNVIKAHLEHLKAHNQVQYLKEAVCFLKEKNMNPLSEDAKQPCGCPGADVGASRWLAQKGRFDESPLQNWPVQITLVPPTAPYLNNSDLLVSADCVPFAYPDFHSDLLKGKILLIGCPKLDDVESYKEKFAQIFTNNDIKSVTYAHMEVPCCSGMIGILKSAIAESGKQIPFREVTISIKGERRD